MDLLAAMQSFVRVAEAGSFSLVSRETGLSQPTVSRHVAELERHYGVRLLNRTTRSLSLTEDGRSLLGSAREMTELAEATAASLGRTRMRPAGLVRLGTPTAFGLHLTVAIGRLLDRWPLLRVEIAMRDSLGDIVEEGLDLAIRVGEGGDSTLIGRKLAEVDAVLVASPAYLRGRSRPRHPRDLLDHPRIAYTYGTARRFWRFQPDRPDENEIEIPAEGPFRANNSEAVHRAAIVGLGLAALPWYQVQAELDQGSLVRLLPDWRLPALPLYLVHPGPRALPLRTRTVMDFLIELAPGLVAP